MPYVIEDHYLAGIPQTALLGGLASRGISDHWTAGGTGLKGAKDTAQFFIDRADRNASYHELIWWDPVTRTFGVLRIVRATRAAHSMNPNPPTWAPNAEVRRILGDKVGDPNAAAYARSFAGMPADLAAAMKDPYFVECYVRRTRELLVQETTIKVTRPLFNHGWGQPTTRTDAGDALIPAIYAQLYAAAPQEADMPTPDLAYVPQLWRANADGTELRRQASMAAPVVARVPKDTLMFTVGEAPDTDQDWRLGVAGDPEGLFYIRRIQWTPLKPTPRDPELYAGIAAVVNARLAGQPVPIGSGIPKEDLDAAMAQIEALDRRIATKDAYVAGYPEG